MGEPTHQGDGATAAGQVNDLHLVCILPILTVPCAAIASAGSAFAIGAGNLQLPRSHHRLACATCGVQLESAVARV